ncbi:MAG TPA: GNAT family N-acetyltransferase [Candidatus Elarobacter sp.]|jgi:ribosomal-protein-alanine N-acetyltransferase
MERTTTPSSDAFLETARLILRDKRPGDLSFLAGLSADPRVMRYIGDGRTYAHDEIEARLALVLEIERRPGHEPWNGFKIIERKDDGARVGQAGMLRCEIDGKPQVEIGWWLAPEWWGHGYATEAALALRDYAFAVAGIAELKVVLQAENRRSVAVAERIGGVDARLAIYRDQRVTCYTVRPPATTAAAP